MPLVPVASQNSSAVRWSLLPLPEEAKVILSGVAFNCAITSASDFTANWPAPPARWRLHGHGDGVEVLQRVVRQALIRCGAMTSGPSEGDQEGVAVGRRALHRRGADGAGGAGLVLDHEEVWPSPR